MKYLPYLLIVLLAFVSVAAVVSRPKEQDQRFNQPLLGDRVADACKPGLVTDWYVDYQDHSLIQVSCYYPKTTEVRSTVVER